ncbi:U6 snRNA-associated Sm-like protein LSm8 [Blastomyces parvus]|uniref:LSM2-LSM8 complex subunit LSM8 n=1 Tax=Blastomyces parvus TaxID=2060905 RepID=A0A2B7X8H7_9EURO|nr:U6 snRNA-associated Sm-like protein LSm8 [Blastomyces parvus]
MSLQYYINNTNPPATKTEKVLILTVDGRTLIGTLLSTDQLTNLVLSQTVERIIRTPDDPEPSSQVEHGLYLIRGDNVVICGEVDEEVDGGIDWAKVKGQMVKGTKNI